MTHEKNLTSAGHKDLLDPEQLDRLERSFRDWALQGSGSRRLSRARILIIFLLIRYTGAKLNEVLGLVPDRDFDRNRLAIAYRSRENDSAEPRSVHISERLAGELSELLLLARETQQRSGAARGNPFAVDAAFVRRKFYERAEDSGFHPGQAGPEMIRKARAHELLRNNMPLPVVQRLLGHSTPNLTASHISFSEEDIQRMTRWFMERESSPRTSARNSFFGKIRSVSRGEVQSLVQLVTPDGDRISTMITNSSAERLCLAPGRLVSAEIKAPWLTLEHADRPGKSSADNMFTGVISALSKGKVNVECEVSVHDGMKLCAILSAPGFAELGLKLGDAASVLFSCYAVILHAD